MLNYEGLAALEAIVRLGSFNKAASHLHLTQSAVSQRIRSLESQIGEPLLSRTAPPRATTTGQTLIQHFLNVRILEDELDVGERFERKRFLHLKIGVNADSVATWFLPAITPLLKKQGWTVEFIIENEFESLSLLQEGNVVGCISTSASPLSGCDLNYLGEMDYRCLARPSFIKTYFKEGFTLESVAQAPAVIFNKKDNLHSNFLKKLFRSDAIEFPHYEVPSSEGFAEIVKSGLVYGLVPEFQARRFIKSGFLKDLTPSHTAKVSLHWHYSRREPAVLKRFREDFVPRAQKELKR